AARLPGLGRLEAHARKLLPGFDEQSLRSPFDCLLEPVHELLARQAGRDRVQEFGDDRSGVTEKGMARPKDTRVEREGTDRNFQVLIKKKDAGLVIGRRGWRFARALREDDNLSALGGA